MRASSPDYALEDAALLARCREERCRSSGPGGQHAQKSDTAVRLVHEASGIEARCQDHRERLRNRQDALRRLRLRLALVQRGAADPAWARARLQGGRLVIATRHADYPRVVAVLLDLLENAAWSFAAAAAALGCSTSQLLKTLGGDAEVRQHVEDRCRAVGGVRPRWR